MSCMCLVFPVKAHSTTNVPIVKSPTARVALATVQCAMQPFGKFLQFLKSYFRLHSLCNQE